MPEVRTVLAKHIFFDVVGFTRDRSVEAQSEIIACLNSIVLQAVESLNIAQENRIFLPTGDGICITLLEVTEPFDISILLAKAILQRVYQHNNDVADEQRKFHIRVGINENVDNLVKDVNESRNIAGQGINMAQRIMNCADGSQIVVGQTVYEILRSREKYMKSFRQFAATGKHNVQFIVYQFLEADTPELNTDVPSLFVPSAPKAEPTLTKYHAYYMAYAHMHRDFLFSRKDESGSHYTAVVLLHFLARDAEERSNAGKFGVVRGETWGAGETSFEEQYKHCDQIEFPILPDYCNLIKRVFLSDISFCFEKMEYGLCSYVFLSDMGKTKLRNEHPEVIAEFQLDIS